MKKNLEIKPLFEIANAANQCAEWSYQEWGKKIKGVTFETTHQGYRNRAKTPPNSNDFPKTWIATIDDKIAGMVSVKISTDENYPIPGPSLASLYVDKEYRGLGIGNELCTHIESFAKSRGFTTLSLFPASGEKLNSSIAFYNKRRYKQVSQVPDPTGEHEALPLLQKEL